MHHQRPAAAPGTLRRNTFIKIISGGQTGADQAALDAAIAMGLDHGGWLPKGRRTEVGPLPLHYRLKELPTGRYRARTEQNILTADGTLILSFGPLSGGSALTEALAIRHDKPYLHIDFSTADLTTAAARLEIWLTAAKLRVLNVAGPRASHEPRIYQATYALLTTIRWPAVHQD